MACWNCSLYGIIVLWIILCSNHAFPTGAPESACRHMLPLHTGAHHQSGPSPYEVFVSTPSFQNGELVNVQILGAAYQGLLLKALSFRAPAALGFWQTPPNDTKLLQCSENPRGAVTHSNTNLKMSQIFSWLPPPSHCPPVVIFVATVAQSHDIYWTHVRSKLIWRSPQATCGVEASGREFPAAAILASLLLNLLI